MMDGEGLSQHKQGLLFRCPAARLALLLHGLLCAPEGEGMEAARPLALEKNERFLFIRTGGAKTAIVTGFEENSFLICGWVILTGVHF